MDYQKELINIIKNNKRDEFYRLFEKIISDNLYIKKHILDMSLSFLSIEDNLDLLNKYFPIFIDLYQQKKVEYDISSYPLIIRISSFLGYFEKSITYLFDMEKLNIPVKTRTIAPIFEKIPLDNTKYFLLKYNLEIDTFMILLDSFDKHYKVFTCEQYYHLLNHFKNNSCDTKYKFIIFEKLKKIFEIWYDIDFIFDNKTVKLLSTLFPYYNLEPVKIIDKSYCSRCNNEFKKHNLTYLERETLICQIIEKNKTKSLDKFYQWCMSLIKNEICKDQEKRQLYYIIDGGNVGHSSNGDFNPYLIINLLKLIDKNVKCLLILHQRHKKIINELLSNNIEIYYTPYNENDDIYWLLSSFMIENSFVITNDQMRDHHVNKLDEKLFNRWKNNHIIQYVLDNSSFKFEYSNKYTVGFQTPGKNILHLPIKNEDENVEWFCMMMTINQ